MFFNGLEERELEGVVIRYRRHKIMLLEVYIGQS